MMSKGKLIFQQWLDLDRNILIVPDGVQSVLIQNTGKYTAVIDGLWTISSGGNFGWGAAQELLLDPGEYRLKFDTTVENTSLYDYARVEVAFIYKQGFQACEI